MIVETEFHNLDVSLNDIRNEIDERYNDQFLNDDENTSVGNYSEYNMLTTKLIEDTKSRLESQKGRISSTLNISDSKLDVMDSSHNYLKDRVEYYEQRKKYLNELLSKYNNIEGRLVDAKSNKYYILFLIWSIIFIIVLTTVFTNLIETQSSMNMLSKVLLFVFIVYLVYLVIKNVLLFMNGYSILK